MSLGINQPVDLRVAVRRGMTTFVVNHAILWHKLDKFSQRNLEKGMTLVSIESNSRKTKVKRVYKTSLRSFTLFKRKFHIKQDAKR